MPCLPDVYNEKGSVWARNLSTDENNDNESGKTNYKWPQVGYAAEKIGVSWETGNTYIFSSPEPKAHW